MAHAVTLWLPDLLNPLRLKEAGGDWTTLELPNLRTLCGKADIFHSKNYDFYQQANYLFHQAIQLPIAAIMGSVELENYATNVFWLRVDPVQMIADRDTLVLIPPESLHIQPSESQALLSSFNQHFAEDHVQLEYGSELHWYLRIAQPVDIKTTVIDQAFYQSVNELYPKGNAATYWHQLMNEVQMLFYTHPVNESRREKGWPEINSVWVWGEGVLNPQQLLPRPDATIWSDNIYLKGLAKSCDAYQKSAPESYQAWLKQTDSNSLHNQHLIYLDTLLDSLSAMTQQEWLENVMHIEKDWLAGLLAGLQDKTIESLLLVLGNGQQYHLQPKHLKRFWRLKKSLTSF